MAFFTRVIILICIIILFFIFNFHGIFNFFVVRYVFWLILFLGGSKMSKAGSSRLQLTITQYSFPRNVECRGHFFSADRADDYTKLLELAAKYWNNARRIANERAGRIENYPLVRIASNPNDLVGKVAVFGQCDCGNLRGFRDGSKICFDSSNQGDCLFIIVHEIGHVLFSHPRRLPLYYDGHTEYGVQSSMQPAGSAFSVFKGYPCNLDPDNPLEFDIRLVEENLNIGQSDLPKGPFRFISDRPYEQVENYPVCALRESVGTQVKQALKRQSTGVAIGFLTGIVTELLDMPQIKALPYYNLIQKCVKILPHLLFIALTIGISGVGLGTVMGSATLFGISSLQLALSQCMIPENRNTFQGQCCNVLMHPMLPTILAPLLIFAGNASGLYGLPETHTIYGAITDGVMAFLGPMAGFGIGKGVAKVGKAMVKCIDSCRSAQPPSESIMPINPNDSVINMDCLDIEMATYASLEPTNFENEQTSNTSSEREISSDVVIEMENGLMVSD